MALDDARRAKSIQRRFQWCTEPSDLQKQDPGERDAAMSQRQLVSALVIAGLRASRDKTEVLVIDGGGLAKLSAKNRRDLLEIIEDRHGVRSTIATSQFPVEKWHDVIGPTLADAILDRLVQNVRDFDAGVSRHQWHMASRAPALPLHGHALRPSVRAADQ